MLRANVLTCVSKDMVSQYLKFFKNTSYDANRSLLDVTTLCFTSEFTRTMRQNNRAMHDTGTDHNPLTNTVLLAGKKVNTLIFPNLESGNITYKLLKELHKSESIGPIMMGLSKAVHIVQLGASVNEIVNMTAIAVIDVQERQKRKKSKAKA